MDSQPKMLKLNVGGKRYTTTATTLDNVPFITNLISSSFLTEENEMFIDRDGKMFRHILQYLRTKEVHLTDGGQLQELKAEAEFYKMADMVAAIDKVLYKKSEVVYRLVDRAGLESLSGRVDESTAYFATNKTEKGGVNIISTLNYLHLVWKCPRNIPVHVSSADCGWKCTRELDNTCKHYGWVQENAEKFFVSYKQ